jgi:hypothetical protein
MTDELIPLNHTRQLFLIFALGCILGGAFVTFCSIMIQTWWEARNIRKSKIQFHDDVFNHKE